MSFVTRWRQWARQLNIETYALYLAYKDPRMPWYARLFAVVVAGYALSPIDLIPDFIPILGYLDDLILLSLGVVLTLKMIPPNVLLECRQKARETVNQDRPTNRAAAVVILVIWVILIAMITLLVVNQLRF